MSEFKKAISSVSKNLSSSRANAGDQPTLKVNGVNDNSLDISTVIQRNETKMSYKNQFSMLSGVFGGGGGYLD